MSCPDGTCDLRSHWRTPTTLRRKDPAVPNRLKICPTSNGDLEINYWSADGGGYTSIRDLLDSSPKSCVASPTAGGCEIKIRNPLLKQAATAYLQLMPLSSESNSSDRFRPFRGLLALAFAGFGTLRRWLGLFRRLLCGGNLP
ncbi:hypothetical protein HPP92_008810 [Vanilla planifolia]|uniref:Uncharacterized protein n=1 Tax=Vanilla planifolia TaxID=51239 RepID=A0A835V6K6_VANPL|nr:hypothetical protein HPP92_009040 [Vanilla planifolia]KAG0486715.1 hypothetical protein HPP92_008810 [Vanilla planifolia]